MRKSITIRRLTDNPRDLQVFTDMFEREWPEHYGTIGGADAMRDLKEFTAAGRKIPAAFAAYDAGVPVGIMALKSQSIHTHPDLTPWAAAGCVKPNLRGHGIGTLLLSAIEQYAASVGFARIYSGTSKADNLLIRAGWEILDKSVQEGKRVNIYMKIL